MKKYFFSVVVVSLVVFMSYVGVSEALVWFGLTTNTSGSGTGTIECKIGSGAYGACPPEVEPFTVLTLRAVPAQGTDFAGWTGNICSGSVPTCAWTVGGMVYPIVGAIFQLAPAPLPQNSIPLSGWAWSSNIGWISLSQNTHANLGDGTIWAYIRGFFKKANAVGEPTTCQYQVSMATSTTEPNKANLTGCAWSPNIGWIMFGNLSDFPTSLSGGSSNAYVDMTPGLNRGRVVGWARACAGTLNGDCTSTMYPRTDGWDGWLELSGDKHVSPDTVSNNLATSSQGVFLNTNNGFFSGYAWGGDVLGWVIFNPFKTTDFSNNVHVDCNRLGTCADGGGGLTVTCTGVPETATIPTNESAIVVNPVVTYSGGIGIHTVIPTPPSSFTLGEGTHTPSVTVTDSSTPPKSGTAYCQTIEVTYAVPPTSVTMMIGAGNGIPVAHPKNNPLVIRSGAKFNLAWSNNLPAYSAPSNTGYECSAKIIPPVNIVWNDVFTGVGATGNAPGQLTAAKTGIYEFKIDCLYKPADPSKDVQSSAFLKVGDVSQLEF